MTRTRVELRRAAYLERLRVAQELEAARRKLEAFENAVKSMPVRGNHRDKQPDGHWRWEASATFAALAKQKQKQRRR